MKSMRVIMCAFLLIVTVFTAANADLTIQPVKDFLLGRSSFTQTRDDVQAAFKSDRFSYKNSFVNLNGAFSKLIGKRNINDTLLASNGMLIADDHGMCDGKALAQKLGAFNVALEETGVEFLYVQAPYKMDRDATLMPEGKNNSVHQSVDGLMAALDEVGVDRLNLMPYFCETAADVAKNFYKTDHHWTSEAAFKGFGLTAQHIQTQLGDQTDISFYIDEKNWVLEQAEDAFLGRFGRKVGKYVAGLDCFAYYYPAFDTQMSYMIPEKREYRSGRVEESALRTDLVHNGGEYFESNAYAVYGGANYKVSYHRNAQAPVNKKVLVIKDSFGRPVETFLSTVYQEIDAIDPREFAECSLMEYVYRTKPDAVVMIINPSILDTVFDINYGYEELDQLQNMDAPLQLYADDVRFEVADNNADRRMIYDSLESHTAYTLCFDDVNILQGETESIVAALIGNNNKLISAYVFDIDYARNHEGFIWMFKTPDEGFSNLRLVLYNGQHKQTMGMQVMYENVRLYKGYLSETQN